MPTSYGHKVEQIISRNTNLKRKIVRLLYVQQPRRKNIIAREMYVNIKECNYIILAKVHNLSEFSVVKNIASHMSLKKSF